MAQQQDYEMYSNHEMGYTDEIAMEEVKNYGFRLGEITKQALDNNQISTLAVFCDTSKIKEKFMGGVIVRANCSQNDLLGMAYQLVKVLYQKQVEISNEKFANDLFGLFFEKIKNDDDIFHVDPIELLFYRLKRDHPELTEDDDE